MPTPTKTAAQTVEILTCSTALDLELFAPLAESIDRHVEPSVHHTVVVPRTNLPVFAQFADNKRRTFVAQEDILPIKLLESPKLLKHLSGVRSGFRRPFYVTKRGRMVRGWMLQQFLKIEMTRRSSATAVMHVDSDVCFFRAFRATDGFSDGRTTFFRVEGDTRNPMHRAWVEGACAFLGVPAPLEHKAHYIENCVLWDTGVARAMAEHVERVHDKTLADLIFSAETMSEYYLYGLFADMFPELAPLSHEPVSYCNSFWPDSQDAAVTKDIFLERLQPKHKAMAVQSTHKLDIADRLDLYASLEAATQKS